MMVLVLLSILLGINFTLNDDNDAKIKLSFESLADNHGDVDFTSITDQTNRTLTKLMIFFAKFLIFSNSNC